MQLRLPLSILLAAAVFAVLGAVQTNDASAQARRAAPPAGGANPIDAVIQPLTRWFERANREYQDTVVKGLSVPTGKGAALAPAKPAETLTLKPDAQTATAPTVIDQVRGWLGMDPAIAVKPAEPVAAAPQDEDVRRQQEARKLEQQRNAEEQRIADNAKKVKNLADQATQQRQKVAEANRLAEEERRKTASVAQVPQAPQAAAPAVVPPLPVAPEPQVAEALKPPAPKADVDKAPPPQKPSEKVAQAGEAKKPVPATVKPTVEPPIEPPSAAWIPAAELNQPLPEPAQRSHKDAGRLAEAANVAGSRALARPEPSRKSRQLVVDHDGTSKGRSKNKCSRPGGSHRNIYVVKRGDTLWDIAQRYYDNGAKFVKIARANEVRISDPDLIFPCQKVYLPGRHAWLWLVETRYGGAS